MKNIDIFDFIDEIAPFRTQESGDNSGFLVGDRFAEAERVLLALDAPLETVEAAKKAGAGLIVTHHPIIFFPQKNFLDGNAAFEAARSNIAVICAHTNFDAAKGGVADVLAEKLGIFEIEELFIGDEEQSFLRKGKIMAQSAREFADFAGKKLGGGARLCLPDKKIETVAVCPGSGGSFLKNVIGSGVDAYLTGDADHHDFLDAAENGLCLIAAGHFETENPAVYALWERLRARFPEVEFLLYDGRSPIVSV